MTTTPQLRSRGGRIEVLHWPATLRPPFGMRADSDILTGPARLRWQVRSMLHDADIPCDDSVASRARTPAASQPIPNSAPPGLLPILRQAHSRGLLLGLDSGQRLAVTVQLAHKLHRTALVAVTDSAAEQRWQRQATANLPARTLDARTLRELAIHPNGALARHDLLVIDSPELMPRATLTSVLEASPANARIGLAGRIDSQLAERWSAGLGPLLANLERPAGAPCTELRVTMPAAQRVDYEAAWHVFLTAFDRFAATAPGAGFGSFVQQARGDPGQRGALRAWHRAVQLAAWHEHKAELVADLLQRHRGQRTLVYTHDRAIAYELASQHLIAAITAEIPRAERHALLQAFDHGQQNALAGPRLLDVGVPEASAEVAILLGGGYGRDQREARVRRVRPHGHIYELTTLDTLEVGRAYRWRARTAATSTAVHRR